MTNSRATVKSAADREIKARVREIAHVLFFAQGFSGTSSDAISKAAGISKKTLYRLFASKEELLRIIVLDTMKAIEMESDPLYDDHTMEFTKKASIMLEYITKRYSQFSSNAVFADIRRTAPAVWNELEQWINKRREKFRTVIEDGIEQDYIRRDISAQHLLTVYTTVVSHCIEHSSLADGNITPGEVYEGFMKIFYQGIRQEGPVI